MSIFFFLVFIIIRNDLSEVNIFKAIASIKLTLNFFM